MKLGVDAWDRIGQCLSELRTAGKYVSVSFVVTRENLHEVPLFLKRAEELQVNAAYVRTLNPLSSPGNSLEARRRPAAMVSRAYPDLVPANHPDFERLRDHAREAIAACSIPVFSDPDQWGGRYEAAGPVSIREEVEADTAVIATMGQMLRTIDAHEGPNPYARAAPFLCDHVYYALQMLSARTLQYFACCFLKNVPGYEPVGLFASEDFFALRNSPAFIELRRRLAEGPLYNMRKVCTYQLGY